MTKTICATALLLVLTLAGCAHDAAATRVALEPGTITVPAAPERGFHYPYVLRIPAGIERSAVRFLLVEPNNTGSVSDDLEVHVAAATRLSGSGLGGSVSRDLGVPLLMPAFPRPAKEWQIYTHQLDRDSMLIESGPMHRLDLQLIAMIDDARQKLRQRGLEVSSKVLMTGFSASGTFVNRFVMLHPQRVQATATGGLNGLLILPLKSLDSVALPYPLGLADMHEIAGITPRLDDWGRVPQLIFMGAHDDNDAVQFDDGYDDSEKEIVFRAIGRTMQPDRWERCQSVYRAAGANTTFRTYEWIGHGTDEKIHAEVSGFLRDATRR